MEYIAGDIVPVTSSLYRVVHDPSADGEQFTTFYAGQRFPPCSECGKKVRYLLPNKVLRQPKHWLASKLYHYLKSI